ncbi:hypothetical protein AXG93_3932s1020 [Marchantia polymorpha subsp. ruderalis]|uniref:Uncharacterized protein n=1 Tax=Marchantia polymorpha subsp. ruderalis TaxID=1480154 RepID=A0A176VHE9_MARPO|nr:hypothetical protein AXG93_3932s1020 [Marchantia polymorpha subsp. ruderalis]
MAGGADLSGAGSPIALYILAGSGAAAAADATQSNSRESPGNFVATEILNAGMTRMSRVRRSRKRSRCKARRQEFCASKCPEVAVRNQTCTKVKTSRLLASLDETIKDLKLKNEGLRGHLAISRKLQKAVNKARDEKLDKAEKEFAKQREKLAEELDFKLAQNRILLEELVRQTRKLEQC